MIQAFPNIQRAVITAKGNGINLPAREVVINEDTLIDMGLFCPMSPTLDDSLEEARERLRGTYEEAVEACRKNLRNAFMMLWQDDSIEVHFDFEIAESGQPYRLRLANIPMGAIFLFEQVECQKVADDKAAIVTTGEWLTQSLHGDTMVTIDPDRQMETLATGRHGHRQFDIRRAPGESTYHLFTWHHYHGEVPAGLRESSGHDWDEAVELATDWFAQGQRIN